MKRLRTLIVFGIGLGPLAEIAPGRVMGGDAPVVERFKAEFPDAMRRNEEFFSHVSGSGRYSQIVAYTTKAEGDAIEKRPQDFPIDRPFDHGRIEDAYDVDFAVDGPLKRRVLRPRLDLVAFPTPTTPPKGRYGRLYQSAVSANHASVFEILWDKRDSPPRLVEFDVPSNRSIAGRVDGDVLRYLLFTVRLAQLEKEKNFPSPGFIVKKYTPMRVDGVELLRVDFEIKFSADELASRAKKPSRARATTSGWFITRPDDGWVIGESLLSDANHADYLYTRAEFGPRTDGIALPKRVIYGGRDIRNMIEFDTIRHGPTPESAFSLTAFGLPEIDQTPKIDNPNRTAYWLIAIGVIVLAVAIGLKIYARRPKVAAQ